MKTFIATGRNSKRYLYAQCACGKRGRIDDNVIEQLTAARYTEVLSERVKRGVEAKRRLNEIIGRSKEVQNEC